MNLQFKILGVTLASIELNIDLPGGTDGVLGAVDKAVDEGIHGMSGFWISRLGKRMQRGR
jgi:hypothetical protein